MYVTSCLPTGMIPATDINQSLCMMIKSTALYDRATAFRRELDRTPTLLSQVILASDMNQSDTQDRIRKGQAMRFV
jgi:hypothetical protein